MLVTRICARSISSFTEGFKKALGDHLEMQTHQERLQFARRRLGLEQPALAQAVTTDAPASMDLGNLGLGPADGEEGEDLPSARRGLHLVHGAHFPYGEGSR